jgi:hypothetical protein
MCPVKVTKVRIDGQVFFLTPTQDIADLKRQIVAASRGGSDFVEFDTMGHGNVAVLITPTESARFQTVERSDEEVAAWEAEPPPFDIDNYID